MYLLDPIGFIIFYFLTLDVIFSILAARDLKFPYPVWAFTCHKCGQEVVQPTFILMMVKYMGHRCDDNLT